MSTSIIVKIINSASHQDQESLAKMVWMAFELRVKAHTRFKTTENRSTSDSKCKLRAGAPINSEADRSELQVHF